MTTANAITTVNKSLVHNIEVGVKDNKTTTIFRVKKLDFVRFVNHGPANLKVTFVGTKGSPFTGEGPFYVPRGQSRAFEVVREPKEELPAEEFPYTAEIEGFEPEDPIVIIER